VTPHLANIPVLETERLRLRAPEGKDYPAYRDFRLSDRSKGVGGPYTEIEAFDHFGELLGHWTVLGYGRWMVADRETDEALGVVGLINAPGYPEPELAWMLFEAAEGKGIATEAAVAARDHAYGPLGFTTLMSLIYPDNRRSQKLARRMGAAPDGSFTHPTLGTFEVWRHPGPQA